MDWGMPQWVKYFTSKLVHRSLDPINQENAYPEQSTQTAIPEQRESDKRSWKKLASYSLKIRVLDSNERPSSNGIERDLRKELMSISDFHFYAHTGENAEPRGQSTTLTLLN